MNLISLDSVSKSLGEGPLFESVSLGIDEGERVGFVGPNGSGKSTLLKLVSGRMVPDSGTIARKRGLVINVLDQTPIWEDADSIRDFLFRGSDPLVQLVGRYEAALEAAHDAKGAAELSTLTHDMELRGGFEVERRFTSFLSELGISDLSLPMNSLSGGMAKKAALARCLAPESELVLLDEPTNHLDIDTIEWLEQKLSSSPGAFVLVTHDRWFLDAVCGAIMEIDGGRVRKYLGGYSDYLERKAEREAEAERHELKRESILRVELEWLKRGPKARTGKDKKRVGRAREMAEGRPEAADAPSDSFATARRRLGGKVLEFKSVAKAYDGREVIAPFSYKLSKGERIGVVGPNGSGKTTLLDLISGRVQADSGVIDRGETVVVGYFDQHASGITSDLGILDFVREAAERVRMSDGGELSAEQFLERFAFPRAMHRQPVATLSGGELRRLFLVRLLIASPNVLLFDEPTNDFDIQTIAMLEDFLEGFGGCVIMVSHDRAFLERLVDCLFVLDGKGGVVSFGGSYSEWREAKAAQEKTPAVTEKTMFSVPRKSSAKLSFKERKEFESLLPEIEALEDEKRDLERRFADVSGLFARDSAAFTTAKARYDEVGSLIDSKTLRWEDLAGRSE
ncbi:MAG: ABC-F family ATP-binding cassette domain-containing protein [Treponemataceae bacterium]